jgi:hypothetical protein
MSIDRHITQWWKISGKLRLVIPILRLSMAADVFVRVNSAVRCGNCGVGVSIMALGTKTSSCRTKVCISSKG